jgi:hypothetical protein
MALLRFAVNPMNSSHRESWLQNLAVTANIGEEPFLAPARPRVPLPTLATFEIDVRVIGSSCADLDCSATHADEGRGEKTP